MEKKWTPAQKAAIDTRGQTLLVSAAAGAGKTAALTERIIRRVTDPKAPADVTRMLIVTFTRAAASELRERISAALSNALALNPTSTHLSRQIIRLSEAKICTIDSFFLDVVRSNFSALGLPPKFRMADKSELTILKLSIMNDLIEEYYRKGSDYGHFFDHFSSVRSDRELASVFLSLYESLQKHPQGIDFLQANADALRSGAGNDFFASTLGRVSKESTEALIEAAITAYTGALEACEKDEAMRSAYAPHFAEDLSYCRVLLEAVRASHYDEARELIHGYEPKKLTSIKRGCSTPESEFYKALRGDFNTKLKALRKTAFLLHSTDIARAMADSAEVSGMLADLLRDYDARIGAEKLRRAICDFDDIRRYTYDLLVSKDGTPTPLARSYSDRFDEIYIDEYQDVDSIQDLIFRSIAKPNNRFMVGDIKQSIYGFRGANPGVFASYRTSFPAHGSEEAKDSDTCAIYMSNNFRCDPPVIRFVNLVCGNLFSVCGGGLAYRKEDDLIASKELPEGVVSPPVEVVILSSEERREKKDEIDPSLLAENPEAAYIVQRIRALLKDGKKADGKQILPREIAVLARSKGTLLKISKELDRAGIPSCISAEEEFFENPEVLLLLCLLNTIDNPRRDVYLTGTLRSPLYGFTLDDLIAIRRSEDESLSLYDALLSFKAKNADTALSEKCSLFLSELETYRSLARTLPVDRLIRQVFANPRLTVGGGLSAILPARRHLLRLYEYARKFEAGAFRGLYQFVSYVERLIEEDAKMELPTADRDDAVKLMTVHKSKGLEFPICFLANAGKRFNLSDSSDTLLIEEELGVAMKLSDDSGFGRINTPMRDAIATRIAEKAIEEEMRVLYVALTRAREQLIVTTSPLSYPSLEKTIDARAAAPSRYSVMEGRSYIEWILYALAVTKTEAPDVIRTSIVQDLYIRPTEPETAEAIAAPTLSEARVQEYMELFRERFSFVYPHESLSRLPAKLSVSALSPTVLDGTDEPEERFRSGNDLAAKRGTATHCFLQFCDFKKGAKDGSERELARLTEARFLSPDTAQLCRVEELDAFFRSEFFASLSGAKKIYREQRFNIFLPAVNFTGDETFSVALGDEKILVQGVIDLFFIDTDDRMILCDYKTDRLSEKEKASDKLLALTMKKRHGEQLTYYALALKELMGRFPDRVMVYATAAGRAVEIDVDVK
ncbi:MAG: helicase-exonuclease AddAB subunit AddA [Clostridia bacterium]|nr:helicase-exonuclease AddAB subunit AddA [Clostridia bacterium]